MSDKFKGQPASDELWRHPSPRSTPMWRFVQRVNEKHGLSIDGYPGLYQWSIDNVSEFWEDVWDFVGIVSSRKAGKVNMRLQSSFDIRCRPSLRIRFFAGSSRQCRHVPTA